MIEIDNILDVEKYLDGIEAVIFDLDDTLYSEKEYVRSGYRAIAKHFNNPSLEEKLWSAFIEKKKAIDYVFEKEGLLERKNEALQVYRFHKPDIHLYPGVADMIDRIKVNHKVGIITDGRSEGQHAKLESLNLQNETFIITDELGGIEFRKPCDKAFILINEFFNVPFQKIVYVGDNIKKDFIAPEKLGMKAIWFMNKEGLYK